jgi:hypothetical protein
LLFFWVGRRAYQWSVRCGVRFDTRLSDGDKKGLPVAWNLEFYAVQG